MSVDMNWLREGMILAFFSSTAEGLSIVFSQLVAVRALSDKSATKFKFIDGNKIGYLPLGS